MGRRKLKTFRKTVGEKARAAFFIDGQNLWKNLQSFYALGTRNRNGDWHPIISHESIQACFDLKKFCKFLKEDNEKLSYVGYYDGRLNNKCFKTREINQQKLMEKNYQKQKIEVCFGRYVKYKNDKVARQKGVDVMIASHIVSWSAQNKIDVAYLISDDTDFIPAICEAQKGNSFRVRYCYFPHNRFPKMKEVSKQPCAIVNSRLLKCFDQKILPFLKPKPQIKRIATKIQSELASEFEKEMNNLFFGK